MSGGRIINYLYTEKNFEGSSHGLIEVLSQQLHGGGEGKIQTRHPLNASLQHYHYTACLANIFLFYVHHTTDTG
jgi:hypothetical protein